MLAHNFFSGSNVVVVIHGGGSTSDGTPISADPATVMGLDKAYGGLPFCNLAIGLNTGGMDYAFAAQPFFA